ncbi:MAG TPA: metallophosphoesterase [Syntrophothermus lipocalidus]|uniref:Metallophosphoesterase n=1 Tax=Syntrophothermus lipocalidus (strain DSM 12680 / TGB-C1) TaxID=643648 RepID=D7CKW3_SYNLT|nr:metallophosphoesterase [Syntrophothermus lipocalidus]ADI01348.1 metallophosphoesterase [Syntrophothermus lipocalidus DSM 12680]HHV77400.1 metallophosphoesterase [Syntrophothermus lipocalidus]
MRTTRLLIIAVIILLYGIMNYYIGKRLWALASPLLSPGSPVLFWSFFWLVAFSYLAARVAGPYLPPRLASALVIVGSYWLAAMFYLFLLLGLGDTIRLIGSYAGFVSPSPSEAHLTTSVALFMTLGIVGYGVWNAQNPRVTYHEVRIPKASPELDKLRIVMVSDVHLGTIIGPKRLSHLVTTVNHLDPDLVLLPGDIVDDHPGPWPEHNVVELLSQLKTRYGTYAVLGNHEYIGGRVEETINLLEKAGITVLCDDVVLVKNSFYLAGRNEKLARIMAGKTRLPLARILAGIDRSRPIILMDHQPIDLDEALNEGVDLQVSGHTHLGQLFPNRFVTRRVYEVDWGYLRKDNLQVIVSCGFGTWGPPIRVGNHPEIVVINVRFGCN